MDATFKEEKPLNPRSKANIFEIVTFSWILKLIKKGLKKELDLIDLYTILEEDSSALLGNKLEKLWKEELINSKKKNRNPSLLRTLFRMYGTQLICITIILTILETCISIGLSTIVGKIVSYFETYKPTNQKQDGIYLAVCLIAVLLMRSINFNTFDMILSHTAMKLRIATCNIIYKKSLRLKTNSEDQTTTGQIINLMSNDVNRFDISIIYVPYLLLGVLQTIVVTYFLWQEVGVSSVLGVATLFVFIPLQIWLGSKTSENRLKTAKRTDKRVHLMNEIISSLQIIKMYTWEPFFNNLTTFARKKEMNKIIKSVYIKGILSSFFLFNTRIALFVNLLAFVLLGNNIISSKVFVITSYYNILRGTLTVGFPPGIGLSAELLVSIKRIEDFLLYEEKDKQITTNQIKPTDICRKTINNGVVLSNGSNQINIGIQSTNFGIVMSNASAKWTDGQIDNTLENINLTVTPGRLVAIIGRVGAGKSSLIQAILQELPLSGGSISVRGIVSYASQEPWLFPGSIKQNIIFGSPMNKDRYNKVIDVCALKTDLEQFRYGDQTIVGEKGLSLSGGQRARINLARAIYKQADIYLLDDPLSAVDTRVGKHLFEKCIKEYLKEKTCILITHQIQYLISVDQIVLMENAKVTVEGTYQELQNSGLDFTKLLGSSTETAISTEKEYNDTKSSIESSESHSAHIAQKSSVSIVTSSVKETEINGVQAGPFDMAETRSSGNIGFSIYSSYVFAGGHFCKVLCLLSACIFTQILASGSDCWITYWVNLEDHYFGLTEQLVGTKNDTFTTIQPIDESIPWIVSRKTCIIVFTILTLLIIISAFTEIVFLVSICTTASSNLYNRMYNSITRATMAFLNKNPSGRILNRFSKDIGVIDETLPPIFIDVVQIGLMVIGTLIVVGIVNAYLILPTFVIVVVFFKVRNIYMIATRNVKRLEGVARSPMFTHVNSSLQGLTTIRAFEVEQILFQEFASHQDLHSSAWFLFLSLSRAFGFWLDIICIFYTSLIMFFFIFIVNDTQGGNVGLAITQAIGLTGMFQWVVRLSAELENQMTSVERVLEYTNVPQEPALESAPNKKPPEEWPNKGNITFNKLSMRYDSDSPFVLKNISVEIEAMEKIGVVGRTGAGKSSLIGALFRLALNEGRIIIDGVEIHELGLHDLRSKISIIPQEPVLFSGTMRKNLDPFDKYSDHILWKALDEVELKDVVEDLSDGLNSKISEGGSNLSVGQRQLVCLARAIVQNNKILVLDEATANVDPQTDGLIQNTIRNKFRTCTVLTIAHRLNTVMDSDRILVMDAGQIVEFDHPFTLLKNKNGYLYKMVEQTGPNNIKLLHSVATESFNNR
ncbi:probable multidrug resistance-associated protein lethal(2)03659 isoform X1 [Aphis gossypii]|uniref:probable multidrug resistance-associated protein lethal(2)03659 isoform X1 n=2 Tax=Aphis gossypii TaxID=80765 RepID=UPI002158B363|nr:probable multidrug resistance-associated protein lethal(2)03659 isoform X1 [Aphis gossypii]XP_050060699.1 probable multidrug resistance-associated protein lethal(2)03659 isoform X1 [Aphis gossypii]XP_050060700.1 probable multidrug resistance-associated protein lethal(2)03659 isoform X1 [Aphis gossypii]